MSDDDGPPDARAEVARTVRDALAVHGDDRLTTAKSVDEYTRVRRDCTVTTTRTTRTPDVTLQ